MNQNVLAYSLKTMSRPTYVHKCTLFIALLHFFSLILANFEGIYKNTFMNTREISNTGLIRGPLFESCLRRIQKCKFHAQNLFYLDQTQSYKCFSTIFLQTNVQAHGNQALKQVHLKEKRFMKISITMASVKVKIRIHLLFKSFLHLT